MVEEGKKVKYGMIHGGYAMLEKVAFFTGEKDESANIELAGALCESKDRDGIREIVDGLEHKDQRVANDCIKVLYEIGERKPELIAEYASVFLSLLSSKNNRLVWGGMTTLATIASLEYGVIYKNINRVKAVLAHGSVIAVDQCVTVLANVCAADTEYEKELFPCLLDHLQTCRPKEVAQHAERTSICVNDENQEEFRQVLMARMDDLTSAQQGRIKRLLKKIPWNGEKNL